MALKKCRECGNEISTKAAACPNCGAPGKKQKKPTSLLTWVVVVLIVGAVIGNML